VAADTRLCDEPPCAKRLGVRVRSTALVGALERGAWSRHAHAGRFTLQGRIDPRPPPRSWVDPALFTSRGLLPRRCFARALQGASRKVEPLYKNSWPLRVGRITRHAHVRFIVLGPAHITRLIFETSVLKFQMQMAVGKVAAVVMHRTHHGVSGVRFIEDLYFWIQSPSPLCHEISFLTSLLGAHAWAGLAP
jgi:hypothetical protein